MKEPSYEDTLVWKCARRSCGEVYVRSSTQLLPACPRCGETSDVFPAFDGLWPKNPKDNLPWDHDLEW